MKEAGSKIYEEGMDKEYLPIDGNPLFRAESQKLIFGENSKALKEGRVATVQTLSGTGALCLVGHVLRHKLQGAHGQKTVYLSQPTWPTHAQIYGELLGFKVAYYKYWDAEKRSCDIAGMVADLEAAPEGSIVILHTCAHNPTGEDPTKEEWQQIMDVIKRKQHFPLLDTAYQGFATNDLERDAYAIRLFDTQGECDFAVCQSYAKNMGLYGERTGAAHIVCANTETQKIVHGQMKRYCRSLWSNPPKHGAEIAARVLSTADLRKNWQDQLGEVSGRIMLMRKALRDGLESRQVPGTWAHLTNQIGMFSYTGLSKEQCEKLTKEHHVYLMPSGRISMAGLNTKNIDYVCDSIASVLRVE